MTLVTNRQHIQKQFDHWLGRTWPYANLQAIADRLRSLDPEHCTGDEVAAITGGDNSRWSKPPCDECGTEKDALVQVGQEPDYESSTASICKDCLIKALSLFEQ